MKKRMLSVVLAFCLALTLCLPAFALDETDEQILVEAGKAEMPFGDVSEGDTFFDSVAWAAERAIACGTSENAFEPYGVATRAQALTFLWRYAGELPTDSDTEAVIPFEDVSSDTYYYDALLWAVEKGVAKGVSEDSFAPEAPVTRAQALTFLARAVGVADDAVGFRSAFSDIPEEAYYDNAAAWAAEKNVTCGVSETAFAPDEPCLRYMVVTFLYRYERTPNKYLHDPKNNPTAMADIIEDANAVYGFSPNPASTRLGAYAAYDWSDAALVEQGRMERIEYHQSIESMYDLLEELTAQGREIEEIARTISAERNRIRLAAYADDPERLEAVKKSNLETYGNENGPTADSLYEKYGSWEEVLLKAFSVNAGMDACVGLYDDYFSLYLFFGMVDG